MTLDELFEKYHAAWLVVARQPAGDRQTAGRAGIRAVVAALRDQFDFTSTSKNWSELEVYIFFDEILGDAGNEKVAGGFTREDGRSVEQPGATSGHTGTNPATAPSAQSDIAKAFEAEMRAVAAPDVCVWTQHHRTESGVRWKTSCGTLQLRHGQICVNCDRPISFKEAAR